MSIFKKLFKNTKKQQIKKLVAQVEDLKKEVEELSQRDDNSRDELIAGLGERLEALEEYDLEDLRYDVDNLKDLTKDLNYYTISDLDDKADKNDLDDTNDEIEEIKSRLDDLENNSSINDNDDELNAKLTDFNNRIVALEDSEKVAQIADIKQSLKDLFTKVLKALED